MKNALRFWHLTVLVGLVLSACLNAACVERNGQPVTYPSGWPIKNLTVPPGSTKARMYAGLTHESKDGGYTLDGYEWRDPDTGHTEYAVGFSPPQGTGWDDVMSFVDSYLLNHGFVENRDDYVHGHSKWYKSTRFVIHLGRSHRNKEVYMLTVLEYNKDITW